VMSAAAAVAVVILATTTSAAAAMLSVMAAMAAPIALNPSVTACSIRRDTDSRLPQGPPQIAILLAILEQVLLGGIRFVAIPAMLSHRGANDIAVLL